MANSEIITLVYIRQAKTTTTKKKSIAGQIGCQATGNCPGSPDGQSAPGFRENVDRMAESIHKNGIYSIAQNALNFSMNKRRSVT